METIKYPVGLQELMQANATKEINITYPDGKNGHTATLRDIADRFNHLSEEWRKDFFGHLLINGEAFAPSGGRYVMKTETHFSELVKSLETMISLTVSYANKLGVSGDYIDQVLQARDLIKRIKGEK